MVLLYESFLRGDSYPDLGKKIFSSDTRFAEIPSAVRGFSLEYENLLAELFTIP